MDGAYRDKKFISKEYKLIFNRYIFMKIFFFHLNDHVIINYQLIL